MRPLLLGPGRVLGGSGGQLSLEEEGVGGGLVLVCLARNRKGEARQQVRVTWQQGCQGQEEQLPIEEPLGELIASGAELVGQEGSEVLGNVTELVESNITGSQTEELIEVRVAKASLEYDDMLENTVDEDTEEAEEVSEESSWPEGSPVHQTAGERGAVTLEHVSPVHQTAGERGAVTLECPSPGLGHGLVQWTRGEELVVRWGRLADWQTGRLTYWQTDILAD